MSQQSNPSPPNGVSPEVLKFLLACQQMKDTATANGHAFAGRVIDRSGKSYVVSTSESDGILAFLDDDDQS